MRPNFWKLSQGTQYFDNKSILESIDHRLVYVHKDTAPKGGSTKSQGEDFIEASIGDYFYLTHGNIRIYLLGQFSGPVNYFSIKGHGWSDRPFRLIKLATITDPYNGPKKWWAPNHNSTFSRVPKDEEKVFESQILQPYFDITLKEFGF